jgi:aminopeptidase N
VDWYPFIPPYVDGQGWQAHPAGFFGEHLVYEQADFDVWLRIEDAPPGTLLAASSAPVQEGDWQHFEHRSARNFVWSASPEYQLFSTQVGATTIHSYAFPIHASAGQATLDTTAQALALYNQLYGEYPRSLLSVVEADFLDGMEYDGLYFLSNGFYNLYQGTPAEYLVAIAAHETAHQWFYALVGNDQAYSPWLDEALCTYQEHIFFEKIYPDALDWWWAYRVNYYEPRGWVNGSIYNPEGYRSYRDAVYLNGAVFLDELRKLIGDETFFAFLHDYVSQNWGKISNDALFFEILSQHTNQDITSLVSKFFKPE